MGFTPDSKASPRLYAKHQRYARPDRLRYGAQKTAWINHFATSLSSTFTNVFKFLFANTAYGISQVGVSGNSITTKAGLTADPFPSTKDSGEGGVGGP